MKINFISSLVGHNSIDIVERKGIGHPDTLADMIAEEFSNSYSRYCLENFGSILNHWADKVVLSGGVSELEYGHRGFIKPITAYLFGKAVMNLDDHIIPIENLFKKSCIRIFSSIFTRTDIIDQLVFKIDINNGVGREHSKQFYSPSSQHELLSAESYRFNDTVFCSGFAPYSITEKIAIDIENYMNSKSFKTEFSFTGYDIKTIITRVKDYYDITVCIPFIAENTPSFDFYCKNKDEIVSKLRNYIGSLNYLSKTSNYNVNINTKDFGDHGYLVAFGTALDKGDFGAVGRGNKYSGVISLNRKTNIEAFAGKNPQNHSGKLLTIFAHHLAWKINKIFGKRVDVDIMAKNGEDISNPSYIFIDTERENGFSAGEEKSIGNIVMEDLKEIRNLYKFITQQDVIVAHRNRTFIFK